MLAELQKALKEGQLRFAHVAYFYYNGEPTREFEELRANLPHWESQIRALRACIAAEEDRVATEWGIKREILADTIRRSQIARASWKRRHPDGP